MRIIDAFNGKKALVCFLTCGYPSLKVSEEIFLQLEKSGADIIEIGIPFSDPTAEAVSIQKANICAISGGITTDKVFESIERIKDKIKIPIVLKSYANVVFSYGTERFIEKSAKIGVSGLMLMDIPYEEKKEFSEVCEKYGICFISTLAPASKDRMKEIARNGEGYVHCVCSPSAEAKQLCGLDGVAMAVSENSEAASVVSYEYSDAEDIKSADGVVVDEAIIDIIEKYGNESPTYIESFVADVKMKIRG